MILTEGDKKGISACIHLGPTIALAGVNAINESDLALIDWRGRRATVVFDTQVAHRDKVRAAEQKLGRMLAARRAEVYFVHLPTPEYRLAQDDDNG